MQNSTINTPYIPKASLLLRVIAKAIDIFIALTISKLIPDVGIYGAVLYIAISDAIFEGCSAGKKIVSLKTIVCKDGTACSFKHSIIRNFAFAVAVFLTKLPLLGWLLLVAIAVFHSILIIGNSSGRHFADELADTMVVEQKHLINKEEGLKGVS